MRIIPAIDIIGGKCVRLSQGDYARQKTYADDPLEVAKSFEGLGVRYLHLVDLDGARSAHIVNHAVLERIVSGTGLQVDFGGGLKSDDDLRIAFESGASQITGGSIAVKDPERFLNWLEMYGPDQIVLGADARDGMVAVSGWQEGSGEELLSFIEGYRQSGVRYTICTDIGRDGMLQGPATELYKAILKNSAGIRLIASGGIRHTADLNALREAGCEGAIIGKALYEGTLSTHDLENYLTVHGANT